MVYKSNTTSINPKRHRELSYNSRSQVFSLTSNNTVGQRLVLYQQKNLKDLLTVCFVVCSALVIKCYLYFSSVLLILATWGHWWLPQSTAINHAYKWVISSSIILTHFWRLLCRCCHPPEREHYRGEQSGRQPYYPAVSRPSASGLSHSTKRHKINKHRPPQPLLLYSKFHSTSRGHLYIW